VHAQDALALLSARSVDADAAALLSHVEVCSTCRRLVGLVARERVASTRPRALSTLQSGERLGDRYEIVRLLARGGMGEVYEARDQLLDELVALKTIGLGAVDDQRALPAMKVEVQLARKVSHRNVCRILEFGIHGRDDAGGDAVPFFTMELLRGETLRQRLNRVGTLSVTEALPIVLQVIDGLAAIHAAGIVHRDLKPENVFLLDERQGLRAVVMDLGLARALDLSQPLASISWTDDSGGERPAGTLEYMSPEQLRGAHPTASFDVYALGTIMFELLAGTRPFARGRTGGWAATLERLDRPAPALADVVPGADATWGRVITRCLAVEPDQRYVDIAEVARALLAPAPAVAVPGAGSRRLRRQTLALWSGGVLAAGLVATALVATRRPIAEPPILVAPPPATPLAARPPPPAAPAAAVTVPPPPVPTAAPSRASAVTASPRPAAVRPAPRRTPSAAPAPPAEPAAPAPPVEPTDPATLLERAEELLMAGDGAAACAAGEQAAISAPNTAVVHRFLGKCYMRVQDQQAARRHYRRYLELVPTAPDAVFVRAILQQK
jgi:hypothetical protein